MFVFVFGDLSNSDDNPPPFLTCALVISCDVILIFSCVFKKSAMKVCFFF